MRFAIYSRRALTYSTVSDFVGLAAYWRRAAKQQWYVRTSIVAASETETSTVGLNISFTFEELLFCSNALEWVYSTINGTYVR